MFWGKHRWHATNERTVRLYTPQWRSRIAFATLFGFLLAMKNEIVTRTDELYREMDDSHRLGPFKVPGPETLCPPFSSADSTRIHFIESSGEECLTPRQACGIESASRANPHMSIKLYFNAKRIGAPSWDHRLLRPGRVRSCAINQLIADQFSNVEIIRTDFTEMLRKTAFASLIESGYLQKSSWSVVQISDAIRIVLLKEHGGFYLDFDNIVLRPLHCLRNTLSYIAEAPNIENGAMVMDAGHPFLSFLEDYLIREHDPNDRLSMGPPTVGRAFKLFCRTGRITAGQYQCKGNATVRLIHPDAFYPVKHNQNGYFYSDTLDGYNTEPMERAYLTHAYLSSWGTKVQPRSLYARLARQYCPSVWNMTLGEAIPLGF